MKKREVADRQKEIIRTAYPNAINIGDKNVYYLDGEEIVALCGLDGTLRITTLNNSGWRFNRKK